MDKVDLSDNIDIEEDDDSWKLDLETILLSECDFGSLRNICRGRPVPNHLRKDVWRICLNAPNQVSSLDDFDDMFNLSEQQTLHEDCQSFADSHADEESKFSLMSDLESVLTHFSRTYSLPYNKTNGWLNLMQGLVGLKLDRYDLYAHFSSVNHRYISAGFGTDNRAFAVFRLLLQYHEPELCLFLDTKRVLPESYADSWFTALFSTDVSTDVLLKLWDVYFLTADPFLMYFLALVILINSKEHLLATLEASSEEVIKQIRSVPSSLEPDDIEDFCSLAQHYAAITPESFRAKYSPLLFGNAQLDIDGLALIQSLCLTVSVHELLQAQSEFDRPVKFLLVDCRPPEQYNAGHLSTAFYLDSQLMLRNPTEFQTTVNALLMTQKHALAAGSKAAGDHICFLSSGRDEEDGVVHMVIAQFLQRKTAYVSLVQGGFVALHEVLGPHCANSLMSHDAKVCLVCLAETGSECESETSQNSSSFSGPSVVSREKMEGLIYRFSNVMKTRSNQVKEKVVSYVKNDTTPVTGTDQQASNPARHISKKDRGSRPYRNMGAVFSIGDNDEDDAGRSGDAESSDDSARDLVNLDVWVAKPDTLHHFPCRLVRKDGHLQSAHLLLTDRHLFVLAYANPNDPKVAATSTAGAQMAYIVHRRSLASVVKITSKKKMPELITFQYGAADAEGGPVKIVDCDKAIIQNAGDAARLIKIQIQKVLDAMDK